MNQGLIAYGDVEDALTDLPAFSDEVGSLREAVNASQNYLRLAKAQNNYGLVDYLIVIDAERTLLANQLSLAQAVNLHVAASIQPLRGWGRQAAAARARPRRACQSARAAGTATAERASRVSTAEMGRIRKIATPESEMMSDCRSARSASGPRTRARVSAAGE